jgi:hypothetical protein
MGLGVVSMLEVICTFNNVPPPREATRVRIPRQSVITGREKAAENAFEMALADTSNSKAEDVINDKIKDTQTKLEILIAEETDRINSGKKLPKKLLEDIQKKKTNLDQFTIELDKIVKQKIADVKTKISSQAPKDPKELRGQILAELNRIKEQFGQASSSASSSLSISSASFPSSSSSFPSASSSLSSFSPSSSASDMNVSDTTNAKISVNFNKIAVTCFYCTRH